jgi:NADPH:quinone reductase-like Zn-dependent oxidoreductase
VAAALPISGLTASQGLFVHAGLITGQTVVVHGAAGGVGSIAVQLAREVGARVIGTGRTGDRDVVLGLGAQEFLDLDADPLEGIGEVDQTRRAHATPQVSGIRRSRTAIQIGLIVEMHRAAHTPRLCRPRADR